MLKKTVSILLDRETAIMECLDDYIIYSIILHYKNNSKYLV